MHDLAHHQGINPTGPLLHNISAPLLVISGTADPLIRPATTQTMARLVPHARSVTISGGTHALTGSHPLEVAAHTRAFLLRLTEPD